MRFRFCGDLDCPDWVLAEISTLAKITSIKMKMVCAQVIKDSIGIDGINYEKVYKLTADAKYEMGDVKAVLAALRFIILSAAKHRLDGDSLSSELQQLGLPKEHSVSLCKSYADNSAKIQERLKIKSLRLSGLEGVRWRVDCVLSSSHLDQINQPCVQLQLTTTDPDLTDTQTSSFVVTTDKLRLLLNELKQAYNLLEGIE